MRVRIPIWMLVVVLFLGARAGWGYLHPVARKGSAPLGFGQGVLMPATVYDSEHPRGAPGSARVERLPRLFGDADAIRVVGEGRKN